MSVTTDDDAKKVLLRMLANAKTLRECARFRYDEDFVGEGLAETLESLADAFVAYIGDDAIQMAWSGIDWGRDD